MQELLYKLAEQLGTTVPYLWEVLVNQGFYGGLANIPFLLLILGIVIFLWFVAPKKIDKIEDEAAKEIVWITNYALAIVLSFFLLLASHSTLTRIVNPEFWAMNYIISEIKGE